MSKMIKNLFLTLIVTTLAILAVQQVRAQDAEAYINRGNAKSDKGDLDGAIADYSQAIQLDPKDADAYSKYSHL